MYTGRKDGNVTCLNGQAFISLLQKSDLHVQATHVVTSHGRGGSNPLCCVKHLPVRRARTDQLSPSTPVRHLTVMHALHIHVHIHAYT